MMLRWTGIVSLAMAVMALPGASPQAVAKPPNIVFIMADDQGWNDVGYHNPEVRTPNIDRLAAEGTRLEQYYAYPTCSPTRVALLTGRNPARFGVLTPLAATTKVAPQDARLPWELQKLGYTTHISGKWHIGETEAHRPLKYGFTSSYGYFRGQIDPYTHRYKFGDHLTWHRNDQFVEEPGHVTDLITDEAVRVIESAGEQPFFLYVAHHSPHYPLNEPPSWIAKYRETTDDIWRRHYLGAISHLDDGVGKILEALKRSGQQERTLIIYASDNGGQKEWVGTDKQYDGRYAAHTTLGDNRPFRGWKTELYEGGIRVPAVVYWPGKVPAGHAVSSPTHVLDWAPTLLALGGGESEVPLDGANLDGSTLDGADIGPLIRGDTDSLGERRFWWRTPNQSAARRGDWKLVLHGHDGKRAELFHLANDPHEEHDLAARHPEKCAELAKLIE